MQPINLLAMALTFTPCITAALPVQCQFQGVSTAFAGIFAYFALPVSEPTGLVIMGLLLIGLSLVVRKGAPGKRGR